MSIILAIGAHFDDVEVGVGGTLLKHINNGDEVIISVTNSDEFRTGDINMRHREQLDALNVLGIAESQLALFKTDDNVSDVVSTLDRLNPDVVYAMYESDTHQAHRRCSHIGHSVGRKLATQIVFYNSGTSYDFLPNMFSIISFDFKQKLLMCFESQVKLNAIDIDIIQRRESYWSSLVSETPGYAEGFMIKKMIYEV